MEAIGRLAGGIAHDFNNLLTAIIGYSALLLDTLAGNEEALKQVREIKSAGDRAASLTSSCWLQPASGAATQGNRPESHRGGLRAHVAPPGGRTDPGDIDCAPDLWQVRATPAKSGRAVMNLALNARDAMQGDGTLTIRRQPDPGGGRSDRAKRSARPLRGAGRGVTPAWAWTRAAGAHLRAFLHHQGNRQGTGSVGHGAGHRGAKWRRIQCQSELGMGTTFSILLPAVPEAARPGVRPPAGLAAAPGHGEHSPGGGRRCGSRAGANHPGDPRVRGDRGPQRTRRSEAVRDHAGKIDLLLTDVVNAGMGGREFAVAAVKLRPGLKVVFVSGHTRM